MPTATTRPTTFSHPPPAPACWPVVGLAVLAGRRSAGAPTLLSHYLVRHPAPALAASPLRLLQQPAMAAAREFIHDKQPNGAPRTAPRGLSLRTIGGALAGATCRANSQSALLGGFGAAAATVGWCQLRKSITEKNNLPPNAALLHCLPPPTAPGVAR